MNGSDENKNVISRINLIGAFVGAFHSKVETGQDIL